MKSYIIEGNDKTVKGKQLYLCDPEKNKTCGHYYNPNSSVGWASPFPIMKDTPLYEKCGECKLTTHKEFAKTDADGNPIKAPFINGNDIDSLHRDLINDLDGERKIVKIVVDIYYEGDPQDE